MTAYYHGGSRGIVDLREAVREQYGHERKPLPQGGATLIEDRVALQNWLAVVKAKDGAGSNAPDQQSADKPKLVIVSISGGATRSAFWSAVVLDRLESQIPGFGSHVRIVTGASGGMVGAAYYVKQRHDISSGIAARALSSMIPLDSITPVAAYIALREVWHSILPRMATSDRGIVLEENWNDINFPIQKLRLDEENGKIPSIILSPMMIEDGRRLLITNLDLWPLAAAGGSEVTAKDPGSRSHLFSLSAVEFFRLFPFATGFHLATGVRMSATFPYVSPAVSLPTDPPRRVVDAGYYDNYGIQLAAAWAQWNFDWLIHETSGVVLVQIRDAISEEERLDVVDAPTGFWATLARGAQFFTSPLEAAEQARSASGLFRNDQDVQSLSDDFTEYWKRRARNQIKDEAQQKQALGRARAFFTTVVFENSAEVTSGHTDPRDTTLRQRRAAHHSSRVPLNWYLSDAEQNALRRAILTPPAGMTKEQRFARIAELREHVVRTHGTARSYWLSELQTAVNYEQLVQLSQWWNQAGPVRFNPDHFPPAGEWGVARRCNFGRRGNGCRGARRTPGQKERRPATRRKGTRHQREIPARSGPVRGRRRLQPASPRLGLPPAPRRSRSNGHRSPPIRNSGRPASSWNPVPARPTGRRRYGPCRRRPLRSQLGRRVRRPD